MLFINEPVAPITGRVGGTGQVFTRTFTANTTEMVNFIDLAGNAGSTGVLIDWIRTPAPQASITYTPNTATSGDVQASISFNKT
jgi:hypothetical protein